MKLLAALSAAQLAVHVQAAVTGIRHRAPVDLPFAKSNPDTVARDMWTIGSGMAAPWPLLAMHTAGTAALFGRERVWLRRAMGALGVWYVVWYLLERNVRESFRRPNERTPSHVSAVSLSTAMAIVGLSGRTDRSAQSD
jgi:prolipoprotein diacylglyceryltransferase